MMRQKPLEEEFYILEASYFNAPTQKRVTRYLNRGMFRDTTERLDTISTYDEAVGVLDFLMTNNRPAIHVYDTIRILHYKQQSVETFDLKSHES